MRIGKEMMTSATFVAGSAFPSAPALDFVAPAVLISLFSFSLLLSLFLFLSLFLLVC